MTLLKHLRNITTKVQWNQPAGHDTGIKIYNCVAREKVPLLLKNKLYSSFYTCGPTVYDSAHIGHASCYVKIDIIQRILKDYFKINLVTAMNITDIDDKIIKRSQESNIKWQNLANHYEKEFWEDLKKLNVLEPDIKIKVTDHIPAIISFITKLLDNEMAYKTEDGSVYFRTKRFLRYGKLQRVNFEEEIKTESLKETITDFALWKGAKSGEPSWESRFGKGRPGWHIECSTLATLIFGNQLDFHAGGLDLKFPHHENEEAQSCCFHNVDDWVNYWIHTGHLHLDGQADKMSKSLKNTINISEILEKYSADEFRMACLLSNYRTSIEFGAESMTTPVNVLKKLSSFFNDTEAYCKGQKSPATFESSEIISKLKECNLRLEESLKDDFNTSKAIGSLLDLASTTSKAVNNVTNEENKDPNYGPVTAASNFIEKNLKMFGFTCFCPENKSSNSDALNLENIIENIIITRNSIRMKAVEGKNKELFKVCDEIRDNLKKSNIEVKDHGKNSSWNFIK